MKTNKILNDAKKHDEQMEKMYPFAQKKLVEKTIDETLKEIEKPIIIEAVKHYYGANNQCTKAQIQFIKDLGGVINNDGGNNRLYRFLTKRQANKAIQELKNGRNVIINVH